MHRSMNKPPSFGHKLDLKHGETPFQVQQPDLFGARKASTPAIDIPYVCALPTFRRAMRYQWSVAGLEPKDVYEALGHDKATWSKIDGGTMSFQADKIEAFCEVTRNDAIIHWLASRRGFDLRPKRSELQERLEAAEANVAELERQNAQMTQLLRELVGRK